MNRQFWWCVVLTIAVCANNAQAQTPTDDAVYQEGLTLLQQFDNNTSSLRGSFVQTVRRADAQTETSNGTFMVERPGKFVWTYETPDEQIIVADGTNLWNYDVLLDQVEVRAQDEALANSPATILSGGGDPLSAFEYQGSFASGDTLWVQLAAKAEDSDFGALRLGFVDSVLVGMLLGDSLDQVTEIVFSDVESNIAFEPDAFEFTPPAGVDVYGTPAGSTDATGDARESEQEPIPVIEGFG
ncbi:MAG: outer membrane lipoprotein chaperone LolA [Pseudomonadota bacterium]